jgi:hypothetical protein
VNCSRGNSADDALREITRRCLLSHQNRRRSTNRLSDYLYRFFDQLGYVFKFVKDDVVQKLTILQDYLDREPITSNHFDTIQKAIEYETEQNLIKTNPENFTRTLLRLHRALIFIEEFLRGLSDRPASDSTVAIATNAYDSTLYYHREYR